MPKTPSARKPKRTGPARAEQVSLPPPPIVPLPAGQPGDPGLEIFVDPPSAPGVFLGAGVLPYEVDAPFLVAVRKQKHDGLTRGGPVSPDPLPNPLIPPRDSDPLADFETVRPLGSGTYGTVDFIRNKARIDKTYALKKITNLQKGRRMLSAQREAIIMGGLRHRNICYLYKARLYAGTVHLFLETCALSLHEYITTILVKMKGNAMLENMKLAEIRYIGHALLTGLIYMHGEGVLHRDFKSKNIVLKPNGGVKITDFGTARKIEEPREGRTRHYTGGKGTFYTMAPEVICMASDYGFETDMWSFACVFAEMFACQTIFKATAFEKNRIFAINAITRYCGDLPFTPAYIAAHPDFKLFKTGRVNIIRQYLTMFAHNDVDALDLMVKGFQYDPSARMTASGWLLERFLRRDKPMPLSPMRDPANYPFLYADYQWPAT